MGLGCQWLASNNLMKWRPRCKALPSLSLSNNAKPSMYENILKFWFEEIEPTRWFRADAAFDDLIRQRFFRILEQAARAELYTWRSESRGRLAEIIVLDQFSRNIHRNTPLAFAHDTMALILAQEAVALGVHTMLTPQETSFLLLPYMHSESRCIHAVAESLYRDYAPTGNYEYELRHKAIVDRFGRYPHRNNILGRASTADEKEFLMQPGAGF